MILVNKLIISFNKYDIVYYKFLTLLIILNNMTEMNKLFPNFAAIFTIVENSKFENSENFLHFSRLRCSISKSDR